jgi:hypothetical protein
MLIITMHHTDEAKLEHGRTYMATHGAPTIRVVDRGDAYVALEGTHRIAAAAELGLTPILDTMDPDAPTPEDIEDETGEYGYTAGELAERYDLGDEGTLYTF